MRKSQLLLPVLLLLCYFSTFINASGQTFPSKEFLLNKITELKEQTQVKALVGGIWSGDREILTVALGESMTSVPATTDMYIRIGGISEMFFGTLVMILVEKGIVNLDDKISKWLPNFLAADRVTIEMLIKNTAGYKDYVLNKDFINEILKHPFRDISRKEILDYATRDGELNFPPGTQQRYSHTEFTILGEAIERAAGQTMAQLYEENIFTPLGLTHTGYSINTDLPSPVLHAFSSDRGIYEDATFWNPSWTGESGPLYSNLSDLRKWAPVFGKGTLLTKASFDKLVSRFEGTGSPDFYFASGFGVINGWYAQNPSFNGYSGGFGYLPSKELTIIIFTTESEDPKSGSQAVNILEALAKTITPEAQIKF